MRVVNGPSPYFDSPGPWTRSTEGVHGPGVHVLYFPILDSFIGKASVALNDFITKETQLRGKDQNIPILSFLFSVTVIDLLK